MPEVSIRPAIPGDLPTLTNIDCSYQTVRVWQMDRLVEDGQYGVTFHEVRLPRAVRIEYARPSGQIFDPQWKAPEMVLVSLIESVPVGFARISDQVIPKTAWVKDLVINEENRRKGIGTALLLAVQDWGSERGCRRMMVELQSKNYPAIQLMSKMGYEFSGYSDQYYLNQDIALFFARSLR
jgi:GNAT superfamily N-acetyltransferase